MVEMKKKYNNVILLIALGLIAIIYILRHNFLITTYTYAIVIAAISIAVTLIAFIFKATRQKDKVLFGIKSFVMLYIKGLTVCGEQSYYI
jgi:heme/copper-type cytochrome/quinol oxidase subunit 4